MTLFPGFTGTTLFVGLAIAVAFSILLSSFPWLNRPRPLLMLGLLAAAVYFREALAAFAAAVVASYLAARWLGARAEPAARWRRTAVLLVLTLAVFVFGRITAVYVLDMWLALRLVTLFWEVGSGAVRVPSPTAYASWVCLPVTLAGPLVRYSEYEGVHLPQPAAWRSRSWWRQLGLGGLKLAAGLGLAYAAWWLSTRWPEARLARGAFTALIAGPLGFYLTVAGYYGLMQALALPAGVAIPESFNWPMGRENIAAFWANWNMTATRVFRDYLFFNRWSLRSYSVFFNTMVLFALVGVWHAPNAYWILWGLLHGGLFCAFLVWRRYGAPLVPLPLRGTPLSRTAARIVTYVCVCACWYLPTKIVYRLWS